MSAEATNSAPLATVRIAVDCMGGDHGLSVTLPAALSFLKHTPDAQCILVGREEDVRREIGRAHV